MNGWIKLHRRLRDNPYMRRPAYRAVWIELLLEARHEPKKIIWKGKTITLQPGQLTCGLKRLSEWTGVPRGTCKRILDCFKTETMIETQTSNRFSLITINNWDEYQQVETPNETQMKRKRNASETPVKTPKECKKEKNVRKKGVVLTKVNNDGSYGNEQINKVLEALKGKIGIQGFANRKQDVRNFGRHCSNLLEKIGAQEFARRLDIILKDDFKRKNCNNIQYVYKQIKGFIEPKITTLTIEE